MITAVNSNRIKRHKNRESVRKYKSKNPEVHREAVKRHNKAKPFPDIQEWKKIKCSVGFILYTLTMQNVTIYVFSFMKLNGLRVLMILRGYLA